MNETEQTQEQVVTLLREITARFPYPPTPDIAGGVHRRLGSPSRGRQPRLAWVLAVALVFMGLLLAVPQVRAAVFEVIRAGAITILIGEPTPTAVPALPPLESTVPENAGLVTVEDAQVQTYFLLRRPPAFGPPDEVYLQISDTGLDEQVVIMVWLDPGQPEWARLRLHQIAGMATYGLKQASPEAVAQTTVNDQTAYWVEGGHRIQLQDGRSSFVPSNVLIWTEDGITYRLESGMTLEETVRIAESLEPVPETE